MAHADRVGDEIIVETIWSERDLAAQVPGLRYDSQRKVWHGPLAWSTCVTLRGVFRGRLTYGDALKEWAWDEHESWVRPNTELREQLASANGRYFTDERLYPHQDVGAMFMLEVDSLLADDMGVGKSLTTLTALQHSEDPLPALVICPNSVKKVWESEIHRWFLAATPYIISGSAVQRKKLLDQAAEDLTAFVIINYESVKLHSRLAPYGSVRLKRCPDCGGKDDAVTAARCHKHPKELNAIEWRSVIVDEAHRLKDPQSQQTRACWAVMHQPSVEQRWALTGTPIANDVGDLWSIMHGVAPTEFPVKSKFIDRYALLGWSPYGSLNIVGVRPDTRDEFERIVYPRLRRVLKSQVLPQLPEKVYVRREAPMSPKQAKAYRQMEQDLLTELDDGDVVVSKTNLVKATRLLQFSSSYAEVEPETLQLKLSEPSSKLDVLEEILEELGDRQVAVCALSRQLVELAAARLDSREKRKLSHVSYTLLTGAVPEALRAGNVRDFQEGRVRCILFTVGAGGVGVTLTAADTIVFLQRSWSMIENRQATDRVHRIGSERHESITVVDVVAPGTIEERQLAVLYEKLERLQEVVGEDSTSDSLLSSVLR